jgi:membrane-bound ClpP family serine protease
MIFAALGLTAVIAGFIGAYKHKLRPSYAVYMLLIWMLAVSTSFWISIPRYVLSMFPMFMLFALLSRKKTSTITLTVVSFVALAFFTWLFAAGEWTF